MYCDARKLASLIPDRTGCSYDCRLSDDLTRGGGLISRKERRFVVVLRCKNLDVRGRVFPLVLASSVRGDFAFFRGKSRRQSRHFCLIFILTPLPPPLSLSQHFPRAYSRSLTLSDPNSVTRCRRVVNDLAFLSVPCRRRAQLPRPHVTRAGVH